MTARTQPTLSRRHAAGAGSARGLLFTVLGELVLTTDRPAWTSAFIDVLGRLGVEEKATRQALMRTAADGWLQSARVGRRTCWTLTPAGEHLLTDGTRRIYGFTGTATDWDGQWLLVLARTPETERPARHLLRTRLAWAGLGSPAPGVWMTPHADRQGEVERVLDVAGIGDAHLFVGAFRGGGSLVDTVRQAWDLAAIAADYADFLARFAEAPRDPLAGTVELVHAWRRFPWVDPLLPDEFLPHPWDGGAAARLFARRQRQLRAAARAEWAAVNPVP